MAMVNMNNLLNGKDSRWLQLEVCREFQRNKCTRPDTECKFAHPPANVEVQNGRVTACYDSIKYGVERSTTTQLTPTSTPIPIPKETPSNVLKDFSLDIRETISVLGANITLSRKYYFVRFNRCRNSITVRASPVTTEIVYYSLVSVVKEHRSEVGQILKIISDGGHKSLAP
ncbi:protein muscleblind-like isoform X1 [Vespula squamosa]|uniref:Protein muscleblind-like isoform X1 n=1 Tax=Vespula squamosa TaxID=30214 RepID=A0ABD2ABG0_VESSQ